MKKNYNLFTGSGTGKLLKLLLAAGCLSVTLVKAQVTPTLLVPSAGSASIALCSGSFVIQDHAGNSNYASSIDGNYVFYPGAGGTMTITGPYQVENTYDFINIYNGVGTASNMAQYTGSGNMTFTSTPGQTLTLRMRSDGSVNYSGFTFTITYSGPCFYPPCNSAPAANTVVATSTLVCPWSVAPVLTLSNTINFSDINYSFQMSTNSALGPYTVIPNTTGNYFAMPVAHVVSPTLAATTWYQITMTCANGGTTTTASAVSISPGLTATNTVPYFEGFEGIVNNRDLPNCSWSRSDGYQAGSRTASVNAWRQARTGNKFAEFDASNSVYSQQRYFYTNGLILNAGVTYSASLWYATSGSPTWNNLSILYGTSQTPTGLTNIATALNTNNQAYQALGGTFTVAASGTYYLAIRATENGYGTQLVWDDLSVTTPCQFTNNAAYISLNGPTSVCLGQTININASGAGTYSWSNGSNASGIAVAPPFMTTYSVTGTNPLTGCLGSASQLVFVNPPPSVNIVALKSVVCSGEPVTLIATGANNYTWTSGPVFGAALTVTPSASNNTFVVTGVNSFGCSNTATQQIVVNPLPVIAVTGNTLICNLQTANLTSSGAGPAGSYEWRTNVIHLGNSVSFAPSVTTTYTVSGTDANDCTGKHQLVIVVEPCLGLKDNAASTNGVSVFPNPNNGMFTVVTANGLNKTIQVIDVTGRVVLSNTTSSDTAELNISALSNGVYYVKVISDAATEVVKVVKY